MNIDFTKIFNADGTVKSSGIPVKQEPPFYRTCTECNYKVLVTKNIPVYGKELTEAYREAKCPKCKSPGALDWGSYEMPYDPILDEGEEL